MAAPTQEYPPWLTPVPTTIFDINGMPLATSTEILYLPLTYYGPSIPLGTDWTYGGLTSPASTSMPSSTSASITSVTTSASLTSPSTTTTAIPSSSSLTTTPTFTATPSASSVSLSSSFTSTSLTSTSPSFTPSPTPNSNAGNHLSRGQLIGIIIASILGFIFIFIATVLIWLCCKGRRNRDHALPFTFIGQRNGRNGFGGSYEVVAPDGLTTWAERSPRHSGEEADSFLRRSGAGPDPNADPELGGARTRGPRVPVPDVNNATRSSGGSGGSSTNHSGYGVLVERPTLNLLPSTTSELDHHRRGHILTPEQQRQLDVESVLPPSDHLPLVPPPRLIDPALARLRDSLPLTSKSSQASISGYPDADEAPTLHVARRVRAEELASRSPPRLEQDLEGESSQNTGGLWASLGLDRLSWFRNSNNGSRRNSRATSVALMSEDDDPEIGKALLEPPEMSENQPARRIGLGLTIDGERPISTASARSAGTVYHDAPSSPGTPPVPGSPITPLPRALTPGAPQQSGRPPNFTTAPAGGPGVPDVPSTSHSFSTGMNTLNHGLPIGFDVLDTPAPPPVSPFTTASSMSSLRDTATSSSYGRSAHPFPPGLPIPPNKSWMTDESSNATQVNVPFSVLSHYDTSTGITIDVLEDAPPSAGEGWRTLAAEQGISGGRRATFGQFVPPFDLPPEETSVYSHLSPTHSRSTGSDPNSTRRDLSGSVGSAFSASRTPSSGHSLAHSGSVSSGARKRGSPAMSAFGSRSRSPPTRSPTMLNAPPIAHFAQERAGTHRMMSSAGGDVDYPSRGPSEPTSPLSQLSQLSSAPWAVGLDNWTPTEA